MSCRLPALVQACALDLHVCVCAHINTHTHTHAHTDIYIYIYVQYIHRQISFMYACRFVPTIGSIEGISSENAQATASWSVSKKNAPHVHKQVFLVKAGTPSKGCALQEQLGRHRENQ